MEIVQAQGQDAELGGGAQAAKLANTGGKTFFSNKIIPKNADDVISIQVQAAGDGLQLGEKSEPLRIVIPPQG